MEHSIQSEAEVTGYWHCSRQAPGQPFGHEWNAANLSENPNPSCKRCGITRDEALRRQRELERGSAADTRAGMKVDEEISNVVRATVYACGIVMESYEVGDVIISQVRAKVLRLMGVKERRKNG